MGNSHEGGVHYCIVSMYPPPPKNKKCLVRMLKKEKKHF